MRKNKIFIIIFSIMAILPLSFYGMLFFTKSYIVTNRYPDISQNLKKHVMHLSETITNIDDRHPENLNDAANYIENQLLSYGYEVKRQTYQTNGIDVSNILARKDWVKNNEIIVIGAHYDTMDNPGADDNASGVAGMLELARILSENKTSQDIEFVAFANEEPPYFKTDKMGSYVYVENLKKNNTSIKYALILEMIGYYKDTYFSQEYPGLMVFFFPNKGNFIALIGNNKSSQLAKDIKRSILKNSNIPVEEISFDFTAKFLDYSDQGAFWNAGLSAIMVTDTSFFRNDNYHKPTDTYEKLDYERMSELVIGIKSYLEKQ